MCHKESETTGPPPLKILIYLTAPAKLLKWIVACSSLNAENICSSYWFHYISYTGFVSCVAPILSPSILRRNVFLQSKQDQLRLQVESSTKQFGVKS